MHSLVCKCISCQWQLSTQCSQNASYPMKVQAFVLPATQTPRPLTGRGGGKKNPDLFAANYFPAHRHNTGMVKLYKLLRRAKRAAPAAPARAMRSATAADAPPDHVRARSPEQLDNNFKRALHLELSPHRDLRESLDTDTQTDTPWSNSSFVEVFSLSESWESTPQHRVRRPGCTPARQETSGTPARRPRERADATSGNPTRRKYRKRAGRPPLRGAGAITGVKWKLLESRWPMAKSKRRMANACCITGSPMRH